ncbi:multiheme c-type cytochrome, partial [Rhodopirellula sp. UBA1907]
MLLALRNQLKRPLTLVFVSLVVLITGVVAADYFTGLPKSAVATYVGRDACVECHQTESLAFKGSHHDLAMDVATDESVIGDFNDVVFEHDGLQNRLFRDGDRFMVHTEGPDGEMQDFEVKYVFGVDPLQQYMVEFDRDPESSDDEIGRLQVLRISWDTHRKEWFYLRPPDVPEKLEPDDPLHWTGVAQRWQTMCADCHSTNLKTNHDVETLTYHTTFSEIDVSCEACHGPASLHIEMARGNSLFWDRHHGYGLAQLKGEDATGQLEACAPCHSRRSLMDADYQAGDPFCSHFNLELLRGDTYHDDGQIKDEVYVYGSFVQSKMFHKGIRCTDCHDPHSLELKHPGNETCTSCHQHAAGKYDVPSHHHHAVGSEGAKCVNCHMPHTTYMEVDPRRDHSLRVPRPDLSVSIGTPNACSSCHVKDQLENISADKRESLDLYQDWLLAASEGDEEVAEAISKTDQWCDEACDRWYG